MNDTAAEMGKAARRLVRQSGVATLATAGRAGSPAAGFPYASLVLAATDHDGAPLLLVSALAEHTRNIAAERRVSLLFDGTAGLVDPLEGARLTLLGEAVPAAAPHQRTRFLARHPSAEAYAGFKDFSLIRIEPSRGHLVAGFGRIVWIERNELMFDAGDAAALVEAEPGILAHMNQDHGDALDLYAGVLLGRSGAGWRACGIDPEGLDLRREGALARLDFDAPIRDAAGARATLVALVKRARGAAPADGGRDA
ncbi:MAG: HugZ family protein [Alphaproteobacteria bacterium]